MEDFDIIGPGDHPALLAISTPEVTAIFKGALTGLGYKVHSVDGVEQFDVRYNQTNYLVVVLEENFAGSDATLRMIQGLSMSLRRHAVFFLVGPGMETLNSMQAFTQSVHCVINYSELQIVEDLIQKTVAENEMFLNTFRDVQRRIYQKPA